MGGIIVGLSPESADPKIGTMAVVGGAGIVEEEEEEDVVATAVDDDEVVVFVLEESVKGWMVRTTIVGFFWSNDFGKFVACADDACVVVVAAVED